MENEGEKAPESPTILVVDDEPDIRRLIQFGLKKIGYENVLLADNGKEALDKANKFMPELILLDIMMPVMDGFTVCTRLKQNKMTSHIPVIIVSAFSDLKNKARAYQCGADDFLPKPLDNLTLAARTRAVLETRRLREQLQRLSDPKAISEQLFDFRHIFERLVAALEYCRKRSLPFSMAYIDIDYMKLINMEYGYKVGDRTIAGVREILRERSGEKGAVLGSNSDKFLLLLPGFDEGKVHVAIDDILDQVRRISLPIEFEKKAALEAMARKSRSVTKVTLSLGIVTWAKTEGIPAEKLLELAERALKAAKEEGRDKKVQFQFYSKPDSGGDHKIDKTVVKEYRRQDEE